MGLLVNMSIGIRKKSRPAGPRGGCRVGSQRWGRACLLLALALPALPLRGMSKCLVLEPEETFPSGQYAGVSPEPKSPDNRNSRMGRQTRS